MVLLVGHAVSVDVRIESDPRFPAGERMRRGEEELVANDCQVFRIESRGRTSISREDVRNQYCARLGAVTLPQFSPMEPIVGREEEDVAHCGERTRARRVWSWNDV